MAHVQLAKVDPNCKQTADISQKSKQITVILKSKQPSFFPKCKQRAVITHSNKQLLFFQKCKQTDVISNIRVMGHVPAAAQADPGPPACDVRALSKLYIVTYPAAASEGTYNIPRGRNFYHR